MQRLHGATRSAPHSTSYQGEFDSSLYSRHFFHTGSANQQTVNQQIPIASEREVRKSHGDPSYHLYSNTSRHFYGSAETRLVTNVNHPYDSEQPTPSSAASSSSSTSSYMPQTPQSAYDEDRGALSGIKEEVMDADMDTFDATEYDGQYGYDPTTSNVGMEQHVTNCMAHPTSSLRSPMLISPMSNQSSSAWTDGFHASEEVQYGVLPEESTRCVDIPYSSNNYPSHHPVYSLSDYHSPSARPLNSSSCPISSHSNPSTVSPTASFNSSPYLASSSYPSSSSLYPFPSSYPPSSYSQTISQSAHPHQQRVTVHQPRPYRPIPIISLSEFSSSNEFLTSMPETEGIADGISLEEEVDSLASTQGVGGLSLLCQPVSESVLAKFRSFPPVDDSESRCSSASVQSSDDMHMQYPPEIPSHAFLGAPTSYNNNTTSTASQDDLVCSCGCSGSNLYRYSGSSVVCV